MEHDSKTNTMKLECPHCHSLTETNPCDKCDMPSIQNEHLPEPEQPEPDVRDDIVDRVEYAIFLAMLPSNMVPSDWRSGATLGKDNSFRNRVKMAAKLAIIEVDR